MTLNSYSILKFEVTAYDIWFSDIIIVIITIEQKTL